MLWGLIASLTIYFAIAGGLALGFNGWNEAVGVLFWLSAAGALACSFKLIEIARS